MVKPNARNPSLTSQESYSAVIIADLVAEVPVAAEAEQESGKRKTEETNFGYDGHLDGDATNQTEPKPDSNGSGGLSKGVILNAVHFGQADAKTKINEKVTLPEKKEEATFKNMTLARKILFGFSFLPSIMFVLCFAVILPCNIPVKDPCVQDLWTTSFNNTGVTSPLQISDGILFTHSENGQYSLVSLNKTTGATINNEIISSAPIYVQCSSDKKCVVMDQDGKLHVFDGHTGNLLWTRSIDKGLKPSLPTFMPDCNNDGAQEIVVAVSERKIEVMFNESTSSSFSFSNCESVPERLFAWTTKDSVDLIFFCKNDGKNVMLKVSNDTWCDSSGKETSATDIFARMPELNTSKEYVMEIFEDGLLFWQEDQVFVLHNNGSVKWTVSRFWHSDKNRFVLGGKFNDGNRKIALFSSDRETGLKITVLNYETGDIITNTTSTDYTDYTATEGKLIEGKNRDFVLLLLQKAKEDKDLASKALKHINDISSTVISLIADEMANKPSVYHANGTSEKLVFMDMMDEKFPYHHLEDLKRDGAFTTKLTVDSEKSEDSLNVYLVASLKDSDRVDVSKLKITNWDISAPQVTECPAS